MLDFPRIKSEMGIGDQPILEALDAMSGTARVEAESTLARHERHAAENSTLNPGCREMLDWLNHASIATALITRNSRESLDVVLRKHRLAISTLITREDRPFKPDPHPLRLACRRLGSDEHQAWMVGDGRFDIEAGTAAGIRTVWVSHGQRRDFPAQPWKEVRDLPELLQLLKETAAAARRETGYFPKA